MKELSIEILKTIKDLLDDYRDQCISEAGYCEFHCAKCMGNHCLECASPYQETADKCLEMIFAIQEVIEDEVMD